MTKNFLNLLINKIYNWIKYIYLFTKSKSCIQKKFKAHILVVDDDDRIRDLVKQYLNENDYINGIM